MHPPDRNFLEHELLRARERLATVVKTATDAIIVIDDTGRILLFNAAAERMFCCSEQDAIGTHLEHLIPPRLHAAYRAGMDHWRQADVQARNVSVPALWRGLRTTGETFPCEVSIAQAEVGGTRELTIIVRDILERRRSLAAIRSRLEFEKFLFDLSEAFIGLPEQSVHANMEHGLARVGAFLEMDRVTLLELSHDRPEMTLAYSWSAPGVMTVPPVLTQAMQPWWIGQVLRGNVSLASHVNDLPEEATAEKAYLSQRHVASAASIPLRVGGEIAGAISFITVHRHVSWTDELVSQLRAIGDILWNALKRRQAMQAVLAAQEAARESEESLRLIANTAPVMIWMLDVDKRVTYVNQPLLDFTGWPPDVTPGHRWIELLHPDDVERCRDAYAKGFDQRKPFQVEHRLLRHDGEYRWTATVGAPRYGTDRSLAGYVGTAVDITERKVAEEALRQSHAALQERTTELERRTTQLSQLASDLTLAEQRAREALAKTIHDGLQQLLAIAAMNVESQIRSEARRGAPPKNLVQAKNHLDQAITAARTLSFELFPPVLQTSGLPDALVWLASWSRSKYGLEVEVSADPRADSDRKDVRTLLFESVRELLFNAVKHAHVNQVMLDLALGPKDTLCVTVSDRGVGFDPQVLVDRLKVGNIGMGLFTIRERLTLLGGRFEVESAQGQGTRFRLFAPRGIMRDVDTTDALSSFATGSTPQGVAGASVRALRILLVDDNAPFRNAFCEMLQERPELDVVGEAANGLEAIAQAQALSPDVILMDISMPEMDGVEATRLIRAERPFIQILGLSTYARTENLHAIERAGAAGFFTKGVDTQRLIDHLQKIHAANILGLPN
jgi:PAS domain S-box-containing protein